MGLNVTKNIPDASETAAGIARIGTQAEVDAGVLDNVIVSPLKLLQWASSNIPAASETIAGIARIGTQAEVDDGTLDNVIVSPLKLLQWAWKAISTPSAPASNHVKVYAKSIVDRILPAWIEPSGIESYIEQSTEVDTGWWSSSNSGSLAVGLPVSNTGTISAPSLAVTNSLTRQRRARATSAAGNDNSAGFRCAIETAAWLGNAAGLGGFYKVFRFGTNTATANQRTFVGICGTTSVLGGGINPSSFTSIVGMGHDDAGGAVNYSIMHNDAAGVATVIPLGANFPKNTTSVYELTLSSLPNSQDIYWQVVNLETGAMDSGHINSNIPANNIFLQPQFWINTGGAATAVAIDMCRLKYSIPRHGNVL